MIFEVKKFGVTLEWTKDIREAEGAFNKAAPGEVVMYKIDGANKYPIRKK